MATNLRRSGCLGLLLWAVGAGGCSGDPGAGSLDSGIPASDAGPADAAQPDGDSDGWIRFKVRNTTSVDLYLRKSCGILFSVLGLTLEGWRSVDDEIPDATCPCDRDPCVICDHCLLPIELVHVPPGASYEIRWRPDRSVVHSRPVPACPGAAAACSTREALAPGRYRVQVPLYERGVDHGSDPHGVLYATAEATFRLPAEWTVDLHP